MPDLRYLTINPYAENNFPLSPVRVTRDEGDLQLLDDALLQQAKKLNPDLTLDGILKAAVHYGVRHVTRQIQRKALGTFLKNRRH